MKQKVGELYGKPVVVGNPNKFEKHEIPLNELGEGFDDGMEYYKVLKFEYDGVHVLELLDRKHIVSSINAEYKSLNLTNVDANFCIYTKPYIKNSYISGDKTMKEEMESYLKSYGLSLDNQEYFKRITAKEYYSLLK